MWPLWVSQPEKIALAGYFGPGVVVVRMIKLKILHFIFPRLYLPSIMQMPIDELCQCSVPEIESKIRVTNFQKLQPLLNNDCIQRLKSPSTLYFITRRLL